METGVRPLDLMIKGLKDYAYIQIVGDPDASAEVVAMHFLKQCKQPAYFDMRGMVNLMSIEAIFGDDVLVFQEENGKKALEILEYTIANDLADGVVVDDLPSIVSEEERCGTGDEFDSLLMIRRGMIRLLRFCIRKNVRVVWLNQFRYGGRTGTRVWGSKMLRTKMGITLFCEKRKSIIVNAEEIGCEVSLRSVASHHMFANRRTFFGVFNDHTISEAYWLFKEAQRYGIVTRNANGYLYAGTLYKEWDLIGLFESPDVCAKISEVINDEEKTKRLYN